VLQPIDGKATVVIAQLAHLGNHVVGHAALRVLDVLHDDGPVLTRRFLERGEVGARRDIGHE